MRIGGNLLGNLIKLVINQGGAHGLWSGLSGCRLEILLDGFKDHFLELHILFAFLLADLHQEHFPSLVLEIELKTNTVSNLLQLRASEVFIEGRQLYL